MSRSRLAVGALCTLLAAACADQELPTHSHLPRAPGYPTAAPQAGERADLIAIPRFDLKVQVVGPIRTGEPIRFAVDARANLSTKAAEIRIVLPEVEVARMSAWDSAYRVPAGVRLPALLQRRASMAAGQETQHTASVTIPAPGYYRVVVSAIQLSAEPQRANGMWVQGTVHQEIWLLLDERGGRVLETFDPAHLPEGAIREPGPFRFKHSRQDLSSTSASSPQMSSASTCDSLSVCGHVTYYNKDAATYDPLVNAHISVTIYDAYTGNITGGTSATTDSQGWWNIGCLDYTEEGDASIDLVSAGIEIWPKSAGGFQVSPTDCGYTIGSTANSDASRVYTNMERTVPASRSLLSYSRPRIRVNLRSDVDASFYNSSSDEITIRTTAGDDHVWTNWGVFVAAHEYGHAVHEKALNGNAASGSCPSPHYLDGAHNLKCAYSEGFANYHGVATRGVYQSYFESNSAYPGCVYDSNGNCIGTSTDGSIIEGAVAAFLYDMTDAANEAHDGVQYPGSYIADIIRTCHVDGSTRANGADHVVYCFEQVVDPNVTSSSTYFPTRSPDPTSQSESATEPSTWSHSAIRALWKKNLYGEG